MNDEEPEYVQGSKDDVPGLWKTGLLYQQAAAVSSMTWLDLLVREAFTVLDGSRDQRDNCASGDRETRSWFEM